MAVAPVSGAVSSGYDAASGAVSVKIGQTRKFPVTTLLRALDSFDVAGDEDVPRTGTTPEILECFGTHEEVPLKDLLKRLAQT